MDLNDEALDDQARVIATNDEAWACKMALHQSGALRDDYLPWFCPNKPIHKEPLINRGTFLRTKFFDQILRKFANENVQIVILGAGFDTRPLRLPVGRYFEIDLPKVVKRKRLAYTRHDIMPSALVAGDLEDFDSIVEQLEVSNFDRKKETIVMAECCLMYLSVEGVKNILNWFRGQCHNVIFSAFDAFMGNDQFGRNMRLNVGVRMPFFEWIKSVEQYRDLLSEWNILEIGTLGDLDLQTDSNSLFPLDEIEEWRLICEHYVYFIVDNKRY